MSWTDPRRSEPSNRATSTGGRARRTRRRERRGLGWLIALGLVRRGSELPALPTEAEISHLVDLVAEGGNVRAVGISAFARVSRMSSANVTSADEGGDPAPVAPGFTLEAESVGRGLSGPLSSASEAPLADWSASSATGGQDRRS